MMNNTTSRIAFFDPDNKTHQFTADLLAKADIRIGGSRPWDIRFTHLALDFRLMDYLEVDEKFDRIASVGMFEHVGPKIIARSWKLLIGA